MVWCLSLQNLVEVLLDTRVHLGSLLLVRPPVDVSQATWTDIVHQDACECMGIEYNILLCACMVCDDNNEYTFILPTECYYIPSTPNY